MPDTNSAHRSGYTIIWVGLLVGSGFYIGDILLDVYVFHTGNLIDETLNPTHHELWMRTSVFAIAVAFAIYVQILLSRERKSSEHARTAEIFLNSIIENIPGMVFIKDADELRFIRVNHAGEKLLGLSSQELTGKNDHDFFPASQAEFFTQKDREALASGSEVDIPEEAIDTATLGKRWLHTRKVPIFDNSGRPIYLLGISDDITEARQAKLDREKTETRFQTLFNSAADFIFVIDPEGSILQANRYACSHSGYKHQEIIGSNIKEYFTEKSREICECNFPDLRERGFSHADVEFVCKDGKVLQLECVASGVRDENGRFTSFMIIQRDVTRKKLAEKERLYQQAELAHVMRLSTMGEMATGMAHELNQPLTALVNYCATAQKLAQDMSLPEGYLDILEHASKQAHRAGEVIRNLREFVSKGGNEKTVVILDDLINNVIDFISWELRDNKIEVAFENGSHECEIPVNKIQIEQVLINLIRNSIEAIRMADIPDGRVLIATRQTAEGSIEVTVADNGPGIDQDMASSLFDPYQTSKEAGMGMGLTISRSIIEAHDGKLRADTQRQQGALFSINLPGCH